MHLLKKIALIFPLLLISFPFWTIVNLNNNVKAAVDCRASPALITTTEQTTITFTHNDPAFAGATYTFVVKRAGFVVSSDPISLDANGNFSRSVGPFNISAQYVFEFYPTLSPGSMDCSAGFTVQDTSTDPHFDGYQPPEIYEDTNITAYFTPPAGPGIISPNEFGVIIDDDDTPDFSKIKTLGGSGVGPGSWSVNLGTLDYGHSPHRARLYHIRTTLPPSPPDYLYDMPVITVQEGSGGGGGGAGTNPCPGGCCETAIGPICADLAEFVGKILEIGLGVAGGIAFILMVIGAIRVLTSSGDPQRVAGGRDMIIAAVAGLLFLIFSVLILRFIGVEILGGGLNPFN